MPKYLDPKADVVFKRVFGLHPPLLKSFLNAVLPLSPDRQIVELVYLPSEQVPVIPALKRTIADVKCKDKLGRTFIVEMQIQWTEGFKQRLLFQSGQAFVRQLEKGGDYEYLQPVYGLGIIASVFDKENPEWYHHYQVVKAENPLDIIEHLQLIFIELPKFPVHSPDEKKLRLLWLRFLREINEKTDTVDPELLDIPEISEALELAEQAAYSIGELQAYDDYWDQVSREKTLLSAKYREGKAEGKAEGLAEGKAVMLLEIIQIKFNTVPKQLASAIMQMNADELSALSQKIVTAKTIEDIS
jgi:predicted transposase/invertase (TIGR01784 family)